MEKYMYRVCSCMCSVHDSTICMHNYYYTCYLYHGSQGCMGFVMDFALRNTFNCTSGTNPYTLRAIVQVTCTLTHVYCLLEACRHTLQAHQGTCTHTCTCILQPWASDCISAHVHIRMYIYIYMCFFFFYCVCVCACARERLRELININFPEWQCFNSFRVYGFPGSVDAMRCFCSMSSALALTSSRAIKKEEPSYG